MMKARLQNLVEHSKTLYAKIYEARRTMAKHAVVLFVVLLLVINPFNSAYITSVTGQEFFTYHIKDIASYISGDTDFDEDYYLSTGTYEDQKDGELFGIAEGRNVIFIQMESFQNMMIGADYYGQEITPFLNSFIEDESTIYFDNFYSQIGGGNTSDAELAANNSLFGSIESYSYQLFENNYFKGLPWLLKEKGYNTSVMHGFRKEFWNRENIYPNLGIDTFYGDVDFENDNIEGIGAGNITGISDSAFFEQAIEKMKKLEEPYYNIMITLSTHNPFGLPPELSELNLRAEDQNLVGKYYDSIHYSDKCLGEFFDKMKESGLYEDAIFVMYGDHFGLSKADPNVEKLVSKWLGYEYTYDNMANVPLLIHIPGENVNETISISGGQVDILPTVAYLLGFETLDTLYMGQNLLTAEEGFAPIQIHMIKGSFIKDDIVFEMSRDGVFANSRAWDRNTLEEVEIDGLEADYLRAKEKIELSHFYLYNNILKLAVQDGLNMEQIMAKLQKKDLPDELKFIYIASNDEKGIDTLANYLEKNPNKYVMVSSDDLITVFNNFSEKYSGKSGRVGEIKEIDEKQNESFEDMKSRIVPLMQNTNNYSKLEYMGYDNILLLPDFENQTVEEIKEFVETNKPCGMLMDLDKGYWQDEFAEEMGIKKVYAYSSDGISLFERIRIFADGIYGTAEW